MKRSVKILKVLLVVIMAFTLSGCVKFNQTMEIKKDGTMNYNLIYAANKSLLQGQDNIFEEDDIKQLQEKGFTVTDYEDDKMKGVTISRNGILVDSISSDDKNAVYELTSVVSDDKKDNSKLFYVKKGFLKNTYVANFKFDSSSASDRSNINMRNEDGKEDDFTKDDMTSEEIGYATELLIKEGALDVYTSSIQMKKNRPGILLTCMCRAEQKEYFLQLIFKHTSTLGVREYFCRRYGLKRKIDKVQTEYGTVHVKRASGYGVVKEKLEYDDVSKIAEEHSWSVAEARNRIYGKL